MDEQERAALTAINDTLQVHDELFDKLERKTSIATMVGMGAGLVGGLSIFACIKVMKAVGNIAGTLQQVVPVVNGLIAQQVEVQQPAPTQYARAEQQAQQSPAVNANIQPRVMPEHIAGNGQVSQEPVVMSDVAPPAEGPVVAASMEATADAAAVDDLLKPQL